MTALRLDTGIELLEAKKIIDLLFDFYENKNGKEQHEEKTVICCPRCHSTRVHIGKQGYDFAAGWLAERILPGLGWAIGFIGKNDLECKCLQCKHTWEP